MKSGARVSLADIVNWKKLYNCSILDLYDRSSFTSVAAEKIAWNLEIKTLKITLNSVKYRYKIILHSD